MTLLEALHALGRGAERQGAAAVVLETLRQVGARLSGRFTADVIDEAVQRAATALLVRFSGRAPPPLPSEGAARAYLHASIRNAALDVVAESRPELHESIDAVEPAALVAVPMDDPSALSLATERARALLDAAFAEAQRRRSPRHRAAAAKDFADLVDLALEGVPFEQVLARSEGVGAEVEGPPRAAAANRLYKRHERLRRELRDAVDALEEVGALERDEAEVTRSVMQLLLRCQRKSAPGVPGQRSD